MRAVADRRRQRHLLPARQYAAIYSGTHPQANTRYGARVFPSPLLLRLRVAPEPAAIRQIGPFPLLVTAMRRRMFSVSGASILVDRSRCSDAKLPSLRSRTMENLFEGALSHLEEAARYAQVHPEVLEK